MRPLPEVEALFMSCILEAERQQAPYVWGGKGNRIWTPKGINPNPFPHEVFDCSGLITTCLYRAGGPDLRFTHGAKQLREQCPLLGGGLRLRFYPGHVALRIADPVSVTVIEAAGGDHTTLQPTAHGYVRKGPERRRDFISEGSLSALCLKLGVLP